VIGPNNVRAVELVVNTLIEGSCVIFPELHGMSLEVLYKEHIAPAMKHALDTGDKYWLVLAS